MKINIVDALPGIGKTSAAINFINQSSDDMKFLYITPFLNEVERIISSCPNKHFVQPEGKGAKLKDIKRMFSRGENIVSTHSLFSKFDQEVIDIAKLYSYTLIMDEVADVVQQLPITKSDLQILLNGFVEVVDGHLLQWTQPSYVGRFQEYKTLCELDAVGIYGDDVLLWLFPVKTFYAFDNIYILTYMFDAQVQRYYFDYYDVEYKYIYVAGNSIDTYAFSETEVQYELPKYNELVEFCNNEKLNKIGESENALSKTWYLRNSDNECIKQLQRNLYNYFHNIQKSTSTESLWTTFSDFENKVKCKKYSKRFLACNARATNNYKESTSVAYLANRYFSPAIKNFFIQNKIRIEEDKYALSELIQWVFRSAIRDRKKINIYIPSIRMRRLLQNWLMEISANNQKEEKYE